MASIWAGLIGTIASEVQSISNTSYATGVQRSDKADIRTSG
jgi:hypothetical protein